MEKHTTTLIDGNFKKDKARTLLLDLLSQKINYHKIEKFSNEERFGKDLDHSEKRIKELTQEKQDLTDYFNTLEGTDTIKIDCKITMQVNSELTLHQYSQLGK